MPFQSSQQMKFLYSQHPEVAQKWHDEQKQSMGKGSFKKLPKYKKRRSSHKGVQSKKKSEVIK